ncbi:MAG: J domain-containing protein [Chloroflexota bacterium]|nr:J domain-containing protein [Chloroflexota bacterium]
MPLEPKIWLRQQIAAIDSVRSTAIDPAGHLIAHTWSSGVVHIHLLDDLPKPRILKRILSENTRIGVGSLFLIAAALAPSDGTAGAQDETLLGLHALYRDRFYTYSQAGSAPPRVAQVHFKTYTNRSDEREVWYGPDVAIRNLPCYRVWVSTPLSLKGNWMVANFGSEAFWKDADYAIGREAFRREQRSTDEPPRYTTWSNPGWNEATGASGYHTGANPSLFVPRETELDRCYALIGVGRGASGDEVKAAFRRLARQVHPDTSTLPKAEAESRFKKLLDAYNKIKTANGW